jgi:hypothetical protein
MQFFALSNTEQRPSIVIPVLQWRPKIQVYSLRILNQTIYDKYNILWKFRNRILSEPFVRKYS